MVKIILKGVLMVDNNWLKHLLKLFHQNNLRNKSKAYQYQEEINKASMKMHPIHRMCLLRNNQVEQGRTQWSIILKMWTTLIIITFHSILVQLGCLFTNSNLKLLKKINNQKLYLQLDWHIKWVHWLGHLIIHLRRPLIKRISQGGRKMSMVAPPQ